MSTTSSMENHGKGLLGGAIYAALAALVGYALGYILLLLAGQNLIVVNTANLTASSIVRNVVASQYAGATILPYLFAFAFAILGFSYGYMRHS